MAEEKNKSETIEKPYLTIGSKRIALDPFLDDLEYNFDEWLETRDNINKKEAVEAYSQIFQGIANGTIKPNRGRIGDIYKGSEKVNENSNKDTYKKVYGYVNYILRQQDSIKDEDEEKKKDDTKLPWDADKGISVALARRLFNGRSQFDVNFLKLDPWDETTQKRGIVKRWEKMNAVLDGIEDDYDADDATKEQIRTSIQALRDAYANNQNFDDDELLYLSNLGIDPNWLSTAKEYETEADKKVDSLDAELAQITKNEEDAKKKAQIDDYYYKQALLGMTYDPSRRFDLSTVADYRQSFTWQDPTNPNLTPAERDSLQKNIAAAQVLLNNRAVGFANWASSDDLYTGKNVSVFGQYRPIVTLQDKSQKRYFSDEVNSLDEPTKLKAAQRAYALDWLSTLDETERRNRQIKQAKDNTFSGWFVVDPAFNNSGTVTVVSPDGKYIDRIPVGYIHSTQGIDDYLNKYIEDARNRGAVPTHREGGILKEQFGGTAPQVMDMNEFKKQWEVSHAPLIAEEEKAELEAKAAETGRTVEQYKAGQEKMFGEDSKELNAADMLRIGAIAADVTSIVAAFVPTIGTAASAGAGLTGAALDISADFLDPSVSSGQAWSNFATNLGLSALALFPIVGSSGKALKTATKVAKWVPRILGAYATLGIAQDENVIKAFNKVVDKPTELTVDDWKNIAIGLQAIAGVTQAGRQGYKYAKYKARTKGVETGKLRITSNENKPHDLSPEDVKKINDAGVKGGNEAANKVFQDITNTTETLPIDFKTKGLFKGVRSKTLSGQPVTTLPVGQELWLTTQGLVSEQFKNGATRKQNPTNIGNAIRKAKSFFYKTGFFNTDHDIFYNHTGLFKMPFSIPIPIVGIDRAVVNKLNKMALRDARNAEYNRIESSLNNANSFNKPGISPLMDSQKQRFGTYTPMPPKPQAPQPQNLQNINVVQLPNGKLGVNMRYGNKEVDFNLIRALLQSGKYKPVTKQDLRGLPGAKGGVIDSTNPNRILFWKEGGSIPKYGNGGVSNTASTAQWGTHIFGTDAFNNWLGSYDETNYQNFNQLQDDYYNNLIATKYVKGQTNAVKYAGVGDRQKRFTEQARGINELIESLVTQGLIKRKGETGDNALNGWVDSYFGEQEYLRHGGRQGDILDYELERLNERLKKKNLYYYWDEKNHMGKLGLLSEKPTDPIVPNGVTEEQPTPETSAGQKQPGESTGEQPEGENPLGRITGISTDELKYKAPSTARWAELYPEALSFARLNSTLNSNDLIRRILRKSLTPAPLEPKLWQSPVTGAEGVKNSYISQGTDHRLRAEHNKTSDASLNVAISNDAQNTARKLEREGLNIDDAEIKRTWSEALKHNFDSMVSRVDTANQNREIYSKYNYALGQLEADHELSKQNAISGYLQEAQAKAQTKISDYQTYQRAIASNIAKEKYKTLANDAYTTLQKVQKEYGTSSQEYRDAYQIYTNKMIQYLMEYENAPLLTVGQLQGWSYPNYKVWNFKKANNEDRT